MASLPAAPVPHWSKIAELDELYTFIGKKKNEVYILTIVDRATRCVLSWDVVPERTSQALQACLELAPQAKQYCSMSSSPRHLVLWSTLRAEPDKLETYSEEANKADLRHYLKLLAHRSRCFSRRKRSLMASLLLFVNC